MTIAQYLFSNSCSSLCSAVTSASGRSPQDSAIPTQPGGSTCFPSSERVGAYGACSSGKSSFTAPRRLLTCAAHDVWLKKYERMLSTKKYYEVCSDLIHDVYEIFDHPRFLHLGYDEETVGHQRKYLYCTVRQGDLWWHDFLWFVKETEKTGMRPWIWSDYVWHHPDLFYKRMPKSVLQSNWYYSSSFDFAELKAKGKEKYITYVKAYEDLDKAGFDQIPTGSNWSYDTNFAGTVEHCRKVCSPERLKGFMMAPWFFTLPEWEKKNLEAIDQVGAVISKG